jgi:hypothetical protein
VSGQYRILEKGEVILVGDEHDASTNPWRDPIRWEPVPPHMIGQRASDPAYPSHSLYRRLRDKEGGGA